MTERRSYRIPNGIVALRVALAFVAAGLFVIGSAGAAAFGVLLTVVVIGMDALDGIVARRMSLASSLGGVLDKNPDRIVEHVYLFTLAGAHRVPRWIPRVVVKRSIGVVSVGGRARVVG
jgi:CDP-diacylglycerol--glycerol-3-phosphate 3-phosphatidyltransferase